MQIYDFIDIKHQVIAGIKNPYLNIEGICTKKDVDFVVVEDGEEIEFERPKSKYEDGFYIKAKLRMDSKYIKVYVLDGSKRLLIFSGKMSIFNRIEHKVELLVTSIYIFLKVFFPSFGEGIKYLWKKHRLLTPFNLWPKYIKKFNKVLKERYNISLKEHEELND